MYRLTNQDIANYLLGDELAFDMFARTKDGAVIITLCDEDFIGLLRKIVNFKKGLT
jgi:hypothetical protein